MKLNWKYSIAWFFWIFIFVIIELIAIIDKSKGDTLSEHFWDLFDVKNSENPSKIMRFIALIGLTWVYLHLLGRI